MTDAYLYDGLRTPIGRHAGALAAVRPDDLAAHVLSALVARWPRIEDLDEVLLGCVCQSGEDSRNIARHALLLAGLPVAVPAQTVNRLCASGLSAVVDAARGVRAGDGELYLAGGVESMSRAPFVIGKSATPYGRELVSYDSALGARFPNARLTALHGNHAMPETADAVAREFGITREAADRYAVASQSRYEAARSAGFFVDELLPVEVPQGRKLPPRRVDADEHPRPDTRLEALAKLEPLYDGGVTTAGNASGINDGAAALVVGSRAAGERAGRAPRARVVSAAVVGVPPRIMGIGPVEAIGKALARADLTLAQVDVIEINEAFAAQVLGCLKLLGIDADDTRVNPNGGALAVGHPLGASGARLALTAMRELDRRQARYAVVSLCIGVGQGMAMVIERT